MPRRVVSIDVFRSLTMLLMIFVNDLSGVKGLPWWNYHMHASENGMTYVDMVFPAFLFIVGMSIPLAVGQRLAKGSTQFALWMHVLARTVGLVVLGIALANAGKGDPRLMGISPDTWALLVLIGAILFWNIYPLWNTYPRSKQVYGLLKWSGFLLMAVMFLLFRRTDASGHTAWLDFSYWEILGLIGWTYLAVCILYIPTRKVFWAPLAWLILFTVFNALSTAHWVTFGDRLPFYIWPFNTGAFVTITMAGVVTSAIFFRENLKRKLLWAIFFALLLLVAGTILLPLGVSKIRATPTWCLYSAGASVLVFVLLYWICDIKRHTHWAAFVKPAGSNTLLTYLLPDLFYFGISLSFLPGWSERGAPGVIKALVFTGLMLAIAAVLTRCKVRLQL